MLLPIIVAQVRLLCRYRYTPNFAYGKGRDYLEWRIGACGGSGGAEPPQTRWRSSGAGDDGNRP